MRIQFDFLNNEFGKKKCIKVCKPYNAIFG